MQLNKVHTPFASDVFLLQIWGLLGFMPDWNQGFRTALVGSVFGARAGGLWMNGRSEEWYGTMGVDNYFC
jgi:hypothetical protein